MTQYLQDNDEDFPLLEYDWDGDTTKKVHWRHALYSYVKNPQVFKCPSNPKRTNKEAAFGPYPDIPAQYSLNSNFCPNTGYIPMAAVTSPSTRAFATEVIDGGYRTMFANWGTTGNENLAATRMFAGHLQTWNILFADGHVKSMRPMQTANPTNMWGRMYDSPSSCDANNITRVNCANFSNYQIVTFGYLEDEYN